MKTMRRDPTYPGVLQAIGLLVAVSVLGILMCTPIAALDANLGLALMDHPASTALLNTLSLGAGLVWGIRKTGSSFAEVCPFRRLSFRQLAAMVLALVGVSVLINTANNLIQLVVPLPAAAAEPAMDILAGRVSLWGTLLVRMVVAPVTEEALCRGLILRGFLVRYPV